MAKTTGPLAVEHRSLIETELRLAGEPETLKAVFDAPFLASGKTAVGKIVDLENSYFDTPDHRLRAEGLALRVRADGAGHEQTLKAGDDARAALLKRGEWTTPLENDDVDLGRLPKAVQKRLQKVTLGDGLQKIFTTRMQRQIREIQNKGVDRPESKIEAALDLGVIETAAGTLPIAEIELELLDGSPQSLYQLALELQTAGGLHLETRSKSSRAYDELSGKPPRSHRAEKPVLTPANSVDDAMVLIFERCFDQWLANQAAAIDGRDPGGVHQMRVGLRRLRSALSIFRNFIPSSQIDWLQAGAKQTLNALGPARDWDVFRSDLLAPVIQARPDDRGLKALMSRANSSRRTSYRAVRNLLHGDDYTRFALSFGHWLEARAWRVDADARLAKGQAMPIAVFAAGLLKKRQKKALTRGDGFAELPIAARHELRLTLKKLRYAVEFFKPLFDKMPAKAFLKQLKALQDDLGHINDVAMAEALLARFLMRPGKQNLGAAIGMVIGWHARGVADLEPDLVDAWQAFAIQPTFWD